MADDDLRLYLIWRTDIDIPYAKGLIQAGHAFTNILEQVRKTDPALVQTYVESPLHIKIALNGKTLTTFRRLQMDLDEAHLPWYVVIDAGRTVFPEPTVTCMAVGPMYRSQMPPFMKRLQLL